MGYFGLCVFRVCVHALRVHNRERGGHSYRQAGLPRVVGVSFPGGKACRVMMLPLSTIEGKDTPTEEVKTKPPEKGALPSEKPEKAPRKPTRMKGTVSFKLLPICPMIPWASSEPALPGLPEQGLSKPTGSCPAAQREPGSRGQSWGWGAARRALW
uniref:Uncharacterized protein n=1 Tax=Sus scrofa TaxID=9823 RepID=A0A8D1P780_PIG